MGRASRYFVICKGLFTLGKRNLCALVLRPKRGATESLGRRHPLFNQRHRGHVDHRVYLDGIVIIRPEEKVESTTYNKSTKETRGKVKYYRISSENEHISV